jgi:hypothetical protein
MVQRAVNITLCVLIQCCRAERLEIFDEFEEWNMIQVSMSDGRLMCSSFQ